MATPGIADPYWYEWYVGLKYTIEMLNPDSGIRCVTFQHGEYNTIDDVVVEYADGRKQLCYQVKHEIATSDPNNLTFGKMLESKGNKKSLFESLFWGWKEASASGEYEISPILYTNRKILNRRAGRSCKDIAYSAYPVDKFMMMIKSEIEKNKDYDHFVIEDQALACQWEELCDVFSDVNVKDLISFLKVFSIEANQLNLIDMKQSIVSFLSQKFSCNEGIAMELFGRLLIGLSEWTTVGRVKEKVFLEDVYSALGLEEDIDDSQHRLAPPYPFFTSRKTFCKELEQQIRTTSNKVVFISGDPGSGKTSTISYLQSTTNLFMLRYHTFRPISPAQHFYNADPGMCTADNLWGTLLIQLRKKFRGKLAQYDVPISNKLLTVENTRKHVIRLLGIAAQEMAAQEERIYVCIDGIDHAARSNNPTSFLSSLPLPNEIPDGVCIVIVGQPSAVYQEQYPAWMTSSSEVKQICMPKLCANDVKQLILEHAKQFEYEAEGLANLIFQKTEGNNLSTVFAIEEIKALNTLDEVVNKLQVCGITADIQQYYSYIWTHMKSELATIISTVIYPESIVACPILLMNGRVNTRILARALSYGIKESDWRLILDRLFPLVVPVDGAGEYSLFHNDFRVFLMGIIQPYKIRYEEIALELAEDLLQNKEGLLTYVTAIPLLKCANKANLVPKYFTPGFVIDALAEGISKQRLDEFAHLSYAAACESQDIEGYRNTYLAVKTLYQHKRYFEYFGREYESNDYPEISSIDISEIRTLPITKDNLDEYKKVLSLCQKLNSSHNAQHQSRAMGLYDKWFGQLTPVSFIFLCLDIVSNDNIWELRSTEVGTFLQYWGIAAAELGVEVPKIGEEQTDLAECAIFIFGEQYFEYCIVNKKYDLAMTAIKNAYVTTAVFSESLEKIYYSNATSVFRQVLDKMPLNQEKLVWNLLAQAMEVVYDRNFSPNNTILELVPTIKHIYDEACFVTILKTFLLGCLKKDMDDNVLVKFATECCSNIEGDESEKGQIIFLSRTSCLLGKYYWDVKPDSDMFLGYIMWFLSAKLQRSFEYSKAHRFLLYTLLHSQSSTVLHDDESFLDGLRTNLFEINSLGMYYKTYILDYFKRYNKFDIIKEYIQKLYGDDGCEISLIENRVDMHHQFCSYGECVDPELMRKVSSRFKWDVVGYMSYKEYAMYGPSEYFDLIAEIEPNRWKDLGFRLYRQSKIAEQSSNRAAYEICNNITKAAVNCGMVDYWELRSWDDEFRINPEQIYHALLVFIRNVHNISELEVLWILSCGIHSWYTQENRSGMKCIYDACDARAKEMGGNFEAVVREMTPQWMVIVDYDSGRSNGQPADKSYSEQRAEGVAAFEEMYSKMSIEEIINSLPDMEASTYSVERYGIIWDKLISSEECKPENIKSVLESICRYLQRKDWQYEQCETIISSLLLSLGETAFWSLANCIKAQLSDYDYQISSRNMYILLKELFRCDVSKMQEMFEDEVRTQELWVTGNEHIDIKEGQEKTNSRFPMPQTLSEMVLYIILEQIESQNARKFECGIFSIYLLGKRFPDIMDVIAVQWDVLSQMQEETLLLVIAKWAIEGICSTELCNMLKRQYRSCAMLSRKYLLHSILLKLGVPEIIVDEVTCEAEAIEHSLPTNGVEEKASFCESFLSLVEQECEFTIIKSIRRFIAQSGSLEMYGEDRYSEDGDINIPTLSRQLDEVLYNVEKQQQWNLVPLMEKKSRLIPAEDPFLLTEMPRIVFDKDWFQDIPDVYGRQKNVGLSEKQLSEIAHYDIAENELLLAACLWYPWGYRDGAVYIESSNIEGPISVLSQKEIGRCIGNFGILASEGSIDENCDSYFGIGGISLFNRLGGTLKIYFGNCQLAPSSIWREGFGCKPRADTPYVWINQSGKEVLRFERIASPIREATRESYIRQPILFRWLCNKEWMEALLEEFDLCICPISCIEPYSTY